MTSNDSIHRSEESNTVSYDFTRLRKDVRRRLRSLTQLDNWHAPLSISLDYLGIAVCVWLCVGVSWWFYPIALL